MPPLIGPVNGLQRAISFDRTKSAQSKSPGFRLELRNAGDKDLLLNLGFMLSNGKKQFPAAVILVLTDAHEKSRRLALMGPAAIAGRMDPLVLPIPIGAHFSLPVDLTNYWSRETEEFAIKLDRGNYSIEAQITGKGVSFEEANLDMKGFSTLPYWQGTVSSNKLQFEVPVR